MVAAPLIAIEAGEEYDTLPPHLTIFPWFELADSRWSGLDQALKHIIQETMQPTINPTSLITEDDLHTDVHRAVRRHGGNFDPMYVGSHWHARVIDGDKVGEAQQLIVPDLAVFQRRSAVSKKMVRAIYKWETVSV